MLIDGAPQQVRLAAQRHKYFVKVPRGARPAPRRFHTLCEASSELIAPASDRFVADDNPALEQQFFDITQAELKPEIPAYRATDGRRRKAMAVVKRFCILYHPVLPDHLCNVTVPVEVLLGVKQTRMHEGVSIVCPRLRVGSGEEERRKHAAAEPREAGRSPPTKVRRFQRSSKEGRRFPGNRQWRFIIRCVQARSTST
ncbi:hypothetical protein R69619_07744 [Paraburkholderia nemoris]|nr:hypothetical protein R69619_07744 [Paraburkholderia nemoris]